MRFTHVVSKVTLAPNFQNESHLPESQDRGSPSSCVPELKVELKEEENKNQLYKIQWDYLVSPINLKKLSQMVITNDYSKYFVVLDEEDLLQDKELYQDVISVFETQETINLSR